MGHWPPRAVRRSRVIVGGAISEVRAGAPGWAVESDIDPFGRNVWMKRCALPFIKAVQCRLIQAIDSRLGSPIHFTHCAGAHSLCRRQAALGEERVTFEHPEGGLCSAPVDWTDVVPADPYLSIGGGRSRFREGPSRNRNSDQPGHGPAACVAPTSRPRQGESKKNEEIRTGAEGYCA
jgi:hypothetical protein